VDLFLLKLLLLFNSPLSTSVRTVILSVFWPRDPGAHQRGTVPQASNHGGRQKVPTISQVLTSAQYICSRKTLGSNMGAPNLFLALGAI